MCGFNLFIAKVNFLIFFTLTLKSKTYLSIILKNSDADKLKQGLLPFCLSLPLHEGNTYQFGVLLQSPLLFVNAYRLKKSLFPIHGIMLHIFFIFYFALSLTSFYPKCALIYLTLSTSTFK